jgi:hypothetical protein
MKEMLQSHTCTSKQSKGNTCNKVMSKNRISKGKAQLTQLRIHACTRRSNTNTTKRELHKESGSQEENAKVEL